MTDTPEPPRADEPDPLFSEFGAPGSDTPHPIDWITYISARAASGYSSPGLRSASGPRCSNDSSTASTSLTAARVPSRWKASSPRK